MDMESECMLLEYHKVFSCFLASSFPLLVKLNCSSTHSIHKRVMILPHQSRHYQCQWPAVIPGGVGLMLTSDSHLSAAHLSMTADLRTMSQLCHRPLLPLSLVIARMLLMKSIKNTHTQISQNKTKPKIKQANQPYKTEQCPC